MPCERGSFSSIPERNDAPFKWFHTPPERNALENFMGIQKEERKNKERNEKWPTMRIKRCKKRE